MIQPVKYVRKPFIVEGLQVTHENIQEVAEWCKGEVIFEDAANEGEEAKGIRFIKVEVARALSERQTRAYPSDWVLRSGNGFKVYTAKAFDNSFEANAIETPTIHVEKQDRIDRVADAVMEGDIAASDLLLNPFKQ